MNRKSPIRSAAVLLCGLLLFLCASSAAFAAGNKQVTLRNEEDSAAKVALLYLTEKREWRVQGWYAMEMDPNYEKTLDIALPDLADNMLYICVLFEEPTSEQYVDEDQEFKKATITDDDFSYILGRETPEGANPRQVKFFKVAPIENGRLWLNLGSGAG